MPPPYTNALIHESSLYLRQHAHNPVNWLPWGEEAFARARAEDKPILLSIGYASCHWCHVMERESFENETVAAFMNQHFINVKVDREERPDVDQVYMDAIQALTGSGGWPLHAFLTPTGKPFYGGTYFPPKSLHQRPSWQSVLEHLVYWWHTEREKMVDQANRLTQHSAELEDVFLKIPPQPDATEDGRQRLKIWRDGLLKQADTTWGGFGAAPKFPHFAHIRFLLYYGHAEHDSAALTHAFFSLRALVNGGIFDHVSGGLARYSTDKYWLVPHFEKMLYDNAGLITALSEAIRIQKDSLLEDALEKNIRFCLDELMDDSGLLAASMDADSEGEEGLYYTFRFEEIQALLGDDAEPFAAYYGLTPEGNWEQGRNILHIPFDSASLEDGNRSPLTLNQRTACLEKLLQYRRQRVAPVTDRKYMLSWNAMFLKGLCDAAMATGHEQWRQTAAALLASIQSAFVQADHLCHLPAGSPQSGAPAFLDDYAFYIQALLAIHALTADPQLLQDAERWMEKARVLFFDQETGLFYFQQGEDKWLPIRKKSVLDGAYPSGNAIMAENQLKLGLLTGEMRWLDQAKAMYDRVRLAADRYPASFAGWFTGWTSLLYKNRYVNVHPANEPAFFKELFAHVPPDMAIVYNPHLSIGDIQLCEPGLCYQSLQGFSSINNAIERIRTL